MDINHCMDSNKEWLVTDNEYKADSDNTFDQKLADEYSGILSAIDSGDKYIDENTMQDFLEKHTAFIPTPFMLNHGLHFNSFISKFPIGPRYTDFAYLTKSSIEWYIVLVEIENPHKKLFKGDADHADFTAEYTQARQQIRDWRTYIDEHKSDVIESLKRIRKPLADNKVLFKYVLVMGRSSEIKNSEARRRAIADENYAADMKIITYDTLLSDYKRARRLHVESLILTLYNEYRLRCKYLPTDKVHCCHDYLGTAGLFSYMSCDDIQFSEEQIDALKSDDYEMDEWLKGKLLVMKEKYTEAGYAKTLSEQSVMRKILEKNPLNQEGKKALEL